MTPQSAGDLLGRIKTALADRYDVRRELGAGGMATVYLARDLRHDRDVALKVLRPDLAASLGPDRFHREIRVAAQLQHPHILTLIDSGEAQGLLYYVMPYVDGPSLRDKLAKHGELPIGEAVRILRDVVDALTAAHAHGVVHRDIKPENILLSGRHALVTDFGVAKAVSEATGRAQITTAGVALGTPAFMAPEQAAADPHLDHRVDIYAVGAVAYELLTGRPVFMGTTPQMILAAHVTDAPEPLTKHRAAVPAVLEAVVLRCLEKKPADRWQSAEELLSQLESLITPSGGITPTETRPVRAARPPLARKRVAQGLGIAVALVAAAALFWPRSKEVGSADAARRTAIAVLPFQNLSTDGPHGYFAGGLHDELLTQLAKVSALTVMGRTSVLAYAGTTKPLPVIAGELGVGSIVEGSVQVLGNRLRVNAQLIDAESGSHVWAERYDRTLDDAFAIQSDIAAQIVAAVGAALTSDEATALAAAPSRNAEAYRLYLQGEDYRQRPGLVRRYLESAQQLYEQAIALDSTFALAYASLSLVHGQLYWLGYDPYPSRVERERAAARTALRLAPDLPQAHWAIGMMHYHGERDYTRALEELTLAANGLPGSAELWGYIGYAHRRLGNWNQALEALERGKALDPRDAQLFWDLSGSTLQFLHRYEDAIDEWNRALALAPDVLPARLYKTHTYLLWRGELDSLRTLLREAPETFGAAGSRDLWRARLALWERNADTLLALLRTTGAVTFETQGTYEPAHLYEGWAHQLRGDRAAARRAFSLAVAHLDSAMRELPNDWRVLTSRGLALAALERRSEARAMAERVRTSVTGPFDRQDKVQYEAVAMIFAQVGAVDEALREIEQLLRGPSMISAHTLRVDPRWDAIRNDPRFQALLTRYATPRPVS